MNKDLHENAVMTLLQEVRRRKTEAEAIGETDWVIQVFCSVLRTAASDGRKKALELEQLSPRERCAAKRHQRFYKAGKLFVLLEEGKTLEDAAVELGYSEEETCAEVRRLIRLMKRLNCDWSKSYNLFRTSDRHTGHVSYCMTKGNRPIASATALVLPEYPVVIQSGIGMFISTFDPETTVVQNTVRTVVDPDSGDPLAKIRWVESNHHHLEVYFDTGTRFIHIRSHGNQHDFYEDKKRIARLFWSEKCSYILKPIEDIEEELAVLLLSFPILRFAL